MSFIGRRLLSSVHRGTAFESRAQTLLQAHLSMSLTSVGGRGDGGVDLQGWWWLPSLNCEDDSTLFHQGTMSSGKTWTSTLPRRRIRVFVQCKAEKRRLGPNYVREMEGVVSRFIYERLITPKDSVAPVSSEAIVAVLVSQSAFTDATKLRVMSSPIPFILVHLPLPSETSTVEDGVGSVLVNSALTGKEGNDILGLAGKLEVRWERPVDARHVGRPGLWWDRKRLASWLPSDVP